MVYTSVRLLARAGRLWAVFLEWPRMPRPTYYYYNYSYFGSLFFFFLLLFIYFLIIDDQLFIFPSV